MGTSPPGPLERAILRVAEVSVKGGDVDQYAKEVRRGVPIVKRLGVEAEIHVWQATYAGKDAGTVIVTLELAKATGDPEYDAWVKDLAKIRTLTSDTLFGEQ